MPTYADFGGWVISTIAGWFVVTADTEAHTRRHHGVWRGNGHRILENSGAVIQAVLIKINPAAYRCVAPGFSEDRIRGMIWLLWPRVRIWLPGTIFTQPEEESNRVLGECSQQSEPVTSGEL